MKEETNLSFDEVVNNAEQHPDRCISLLGDDFTSITGKTVFIDVE